MMCCTQVTYKSYGTDTEIMAALSGVCTVNDSMTPIRLHLRGYFSKPLQKNKQHKRRARDKRKAKS